MYNYENDLNRLERTGFSYIYKIMLYDMHDNFSYT